MSGARWQESIFKEAAMNLWTGDKSGSELRPLGGGSCHIYGRAAQVLGGSDSPPIHLI